MSSPFGDGGGKDRIVMRHMAWQALERQRQEGQQGQAELLSSTNTSSSNTSGEYTTITSREEENSSTTSVESSSIDETDTSSEALLIFEDFWVRTKTPLNYNMKMEHFIDEDKKSLAESIARPVKCFKTNVSANNNAQEGAEGYLQCLSIEVVSANDCLKFRNKKPSPPRRFTLIINTKRWSFDTKLEIKLFKDDNAKGEGDDKCPFAEAQIPLAQILRRSLQIRKDMEKSGEGGSSADSRRVILIPDKSPIVSNRRKIRIGSFQFDLVFGSRRQLDHYVSKTLVNTHVCRIGGEDKTESSCSSLEKNKLLLSGLIVPPDPEEDEEEEESVELILSDDKHLINEDTDINGNEKLRLFEKNASLLAQEVLKLTEDKLQYTSLLENFSTEVESLKKELKSCKEKLSGVETLKEELKDVKMSQERSHALLNLIHDLTSAKNNLTLGTPIISKLHTLLEDLTRHNKGTKKGQNK